MGYRLHTGRYCVTFQREKHDALLHTVRDSRWSGQLVAYLASLTLQDGGRRDLSLLLAVCEYEDVFPDELPGLPLHRDVDFILSYTLVRRPFL